MSMGVFAEPVVTLNSVSVELSGQNKKTDSFLYHLLSEDDLCMKHANTFIFKCPKRN